MAMRPKKTEILLPMRVWDGATRLFHWSIVVLVIVSYASISLADGPRATLWMRIHYISGEAVLALLLFRLIWGVIGSDTSRFARFLRSPLAALHNLGHIRRREPDTEVGHNAAGGWMVLAMLLVLLAQVVTGLYANDDGINEGPLAQFVAKTTSDMLSGWHGMIFNALAALIGLHVVAVLAYLVLKGQNLVRPMVTGKKKLPAATRAPRMVSPMLALATLLVSAGVAVFVGRL
jgi:cytochrome b